MLSPMDDEAQKVRRRPVHLPVDERFNRSNIIFVTVCRQKRKRILATEVMHRLIIEAFHSAELYQVGRYMIMPDHVHFFCSPNTNPVEPLSKWMRFWKAAVTRSCPNESIKPLWQRDFWDRQLRSGESYSEKWAYIANNPVRAGLVRVSKDWPYQGELNQFRWHD